MAVGRMNYSPSAFYSSEIREIKLAIEGYREGKEEDFGLYEVALTNVLGGFFNRGYKRVDPFSVDTNYITPEEKESTLEYLQTKFKGE